MKKCVRGGERCPAPVAGDGGLVVGCGFGVPQVGRPALVVGDRFDRWHPFPRRVGQHVGHVGRRQQVLGPVRGRLVVGLGRFGNIQVEGGGDGEPVRVERVDGFFGNAGFRFDPRRARHLGGVVVGVVRGDEVVVQRVQAGRLVDVEGFGAGQGDDVPHQDGGQFVLGQGRALPGEHPGGVGGQGLRVVAVAGGGVDPGDDDRPQPVGGDPVDDLFAEHVLELGGPRRPQFVPRLRAGGQITDVRGEAPPQRPGGCFGGERGTGGRGAEQGGDVDAGGVGQRQPGGQHRPVVVAGDRRCRGVPARRPTGRRRPGRRRPTASAASTSAVCRAIIAIRNGRGPAGRRSVSGTDSAARHTARSATRSRSARYGSGPGGGGRGVPAGGLVADLPGQVADQLGPGVEIGRARSGSSATAGGDGGEPGQWAAAWEWFPVGSSR